MEILASDNPASPVRDWDILLLPYCDGSFFSADATFDEKGDSEDDRFQLGLRNLSAALDVARQEFPNPRKIFLAGSSGGAYGTMFAAPLTRVVYPNAPIYVFNDSGIGIGRGDTDPDFVAGLMEEYRAQPLLPASRPDLIENGHLTRFIGWQLERDANMKIAGFSSYGDAIFGEHLPDARPRHLRRLCRGGSWVGVEAHVR